MATAAGDLPSLLVQHVPGRHTVTAGVWCARGSAHDPPELAGATHLLEHLTLRRCGGRERHDLACAVDRLGGEVDAWTGPEMMGVTVQTTVDALDDALALLVDAVLEPTLERADVELERRVALAELELIADDPSEQVDEAILQAAWGEHPLSRPVIGSADGLRRLTSAKLRRHHRDMIRPGGLLAAVAGDVEVDRVAAGLSRLPLGTPPSSPPLPPLNWTAAHLDLIRRDADQVHVRIAFAALPSTDHRAPALSILNRILGVGASSRLFQRLREEEGLTYDVWSSLMLRSPGGLLEVGWACSPRVFGDAWKVVREEVVRLADGPSADEVEVARAGLRRVLQMDADATEGLCSLDVAAVLERGRRFNLATAVAELDAVKSTDVVELARTMLRFDLAASVVCGPEGVAERVA